MAGTSDGGFDSGTPDYRGLLALEMDRLADIAPSSLDLVLPHIEGWTVHAVIGHTGWIARYVTRALTSDPDQPPSRADIPEPPAGPEVLDWFREARDPLFEAIDAVDPDRLYPTFTGPQPGHWWLRRLANEAAMHRWDVVAAAGSPEPIDRDLAREGIEEVLDVFAPHRLEFEVLAGSGETIHLHATDDGLPDGVGEWMITLGPDAISWEPGHAKGDVAARGSMSDLLLLLWSRIPPRRVDVFGDATILDRWQSAATF